MATSGEPLLTTNRNEIFTEAYEQAGVTRTGQELSAAQIKKAQRLLNGIIKTWAASGIHIWTVTEYVLIPIAEQEKYPLSSSSASHAALREDYFETTVSAAEASGQTVISITDTSNIAVSDNIGIQLDDGTFHWTTVSSKTSTTATIASALTSAAESGAVVLTYTNKIARPLKITDMRRRNLSDGVETPMVQMARLDYNRQSNKETAGLPSNYYYDPSRIIGQLSICPREDVVTSVLCFTGHRPVEIFEIATDEPDFPEEWFKPLWCALALDLAPNMPQQRYERITAQLASSLSLLSGHDREDESLMVSPDVEFPS